MNPRAINHPNLEFIRVWAEELAEKYSSTPQEMRSKGLGSLHFPQQTLEVRFQDGSFMRLRYAFFVVSKDGKDVAVFTEHCGYFSWTAGAIEILTIEEQQVFPEN
ncbi:MAG: hypothetical protein ACRCYY_00690 [Trueperaceae bacterium]